MKSGSYARLTRFQSCYYSCWCIYTSVESSQEIRKSNQMYWVPLKLFQQSSMDNLHGSFEVSDGVDPCTVAPLEWWLVTVTLVISVIFLFFSLALSSRCNLFLEALSCHIFIITTGGIGPCMLASRWGNRNLFSLLLYCHTWGTLLRMGWVDHSRVMVYCVYRVGQLRGVKRVGIGGWV